MPFMEAGMIWVLHRLVSGRGLMLGAGLISTDSAVEYCENMFNDGCWSKPMEGN